MWRQKITLPSEEDARARYFLYDPGVFSSGIYLCPYCGRLLFSKRSIELAYIHTPYSVQQSRSLRKQYLGKPDGIHAPENRIACCARCNQRRRMRGGAWGILARHRYLAFLFRCIFLIGVMSLIVLLDVSGIPILPANPGAGGIPAIFTLLLIVTLLLYFAGSSKLLRLFFCIVGIYIMGNLIAYLNPELWIAITDLARQAWEFVKSVFRDLSRWRPTVM